MFPHDFCEQEAKARQVRQEILEDAAEAIAEDIVKALFWDHELVLLVAKKVFEKMFDEE